VSCHPYAVTQVPFSSRENGLPIYPNTPRIVARPGARAPDPIPWRIASIRWNLPRYRSTTADDKAGSELAPLVTRTFRALACASSSAIPATNARICQIEIVRFGGDCRPSDSVGLTLERADRVDERVHPELGQPVTEPRIVCVDLNPTSPFQTESSCKRASLDAVAPSNEHADIGSLASALEMRAPKNPYPPRTRVVCNGGNRDAQLFRSTRCEPSTVENIEVGSYIPASSANLGAPPPKSYVRMSACRARIRGEARQEPTQSGRHLGALQSHGAAAANSNQTRSGLSDDLNQKSMVRATQKPSRTPLTRIAMAKNTEATFARNHSPCLKAFTRPIADDRRRRRPTRSTRETRHIAAFNLSD
jgi:hypothetical protein